MQHVPVVSSSLASVAYDPLSWVLEVRFRRGGRYRYYGVAPHLYQQLLHADSKGQFFNRYVKDSYRYSRQDAL